MKIEFETAGKFQKIVDAMAKLLDTAFFTIRKKGISLKGMDPSHVAMVDLFIPQELATTYDVKKDQRLHINLFDLNKFMKRGTASELLELSLDQQRNKLKVKFKKEKSTRTFSLGLLTEDEEEEAPSPKLDFNAKVKMSSSDLQRAIKDAQIVGDYLTFILSEEALTLESSGDTGDVSIEIKEFIDSPVLKEKQSSNFSIEYLGDMVGTLVSDEVTLEFSTEMPISLKFDLDHEGFLSYMLAPRVEDDDEDFDEDTENDESELEEEEELEEDTGGKKEEEESEEKPEKPAKSAKSAKKKRKKKTEA